MESGTILLVDKISPALKSQIQSNAFVDLSELLYPSEGKQRIEMDVEKRSQLDYLSLMPKKSQFFDQLD